MNDNETKRLSRLTTILTQNHFSKQAVRLVFYIKSSRKKSITWRDAVDVKY